MSAHVKVWVWRGLSGCWVWDCICIPDDGGNPLFPTHAEALAAAWAHIKEHT